MKWGQLQKFGRLLVILPFCFYSPLSCAADQTASNNIQSVIESDPALRAQLLETLRKNPQLQQQVQQHMGVKPTDTTQGNSLFQTASQSPNQSIQQQLVNVQNKTNGQTQPQKPGNANPAQQQQSNGQTQQQMTAGTAPTAQDEHAQKEKHEKFEKAINDAAFDAVKKEAFPLTPDQIKELRDMLDDTQRASATEPYERAPEPTSSSTVVNLSPGSTPPVIRLARGFVSSLVFIDSTGAPWPIQAFDLGNPSAFDIQWNKTDNTLMVQARSTYTYGNLAVVLQNLDTPVMLTLVPGQRVVDYRVDLRLPGLGPNANVAAIHATGMPDQANSTLLSILDGIPPKGAKRLKVQHGYAQAWVLDKTMYVRTRYNVLSPAWIGQMSSADGMHAYEMPRTPMLLVSRHGKPIQIRVEGY